MLPNRLLTFEFDSAFIVLLVYMKFLLPLFASLNKYCCDTTASSNEIRAVSFSWHSRNQAHSSSGLRQWIRKF